MIFNRSYHGTNVAEGKGDEFKGRIFGKYF